MENKNVDYIDRVFFHSMLTTEDYLSFYGIASNVYGEMYVNEVKAYIKAHNLTEYCEVPLCNLTLRLKMFARLFITKKKSPDVVMIDNIDGEYREEELTEIVELFQKVMQKLKCSCIIMTKELPRPSTLQAEVYRL